MIKDKSKDINFELAANMLMEKGYCLIDRPVLDDRSLRNALAAFMQTPEKDRLQYLQKHFDRAFDGYSFLGQTDSLNQDHEDLVHTFVLSDLGPVEEFPIDFQGYLKTDFDQTLAEITRIEEGLIKHIDGLIDLETYRQQIGHMVSCNFYPKPIDNQALPENRPRLTEHPDVSLFTIFPYGNDSCFEAEVNGKWQSIDAMNKWLVFSGYLPHYSGHELKSLNHRVRLNSNDAERYSFAFFSIPKPNAELIINQNRIQSDRYFEDYLAIF